MAETVFIQGESGSVIEHDLPLPEGVADRLRHGVIFLVDADGNPIPETPVVPLPPKVEWRPASAEDKVTKTVAKK